MYALTSQKLILLTNFFKFLLENNLKHSANIKKINGDLFSHFFSSKKENNVQEIIDVSKDQPEIYLANKDLKKPLKKIATKIKFPKNLVNLEGNFETFQNILQTLKNIKSENDLSLICDKILQIKIISCVDVELLNNVHHYLKENKKIVSNLNSKPDFKQKLSKCLKKITNRVGILNRKK